MPKGTAMKALLATVIRVKIVVGFWITSFKKNGSEIDDFDFDSKI